MQRLVLVPHTHWDREWYRTHEEFRYRLVQLLDGLLDLLESDPGFPHFTLDGQTIVLDDYLEVRPESRDRIDRLVRSGRLLIGPWTVLPDEWLVSGEALVRNLRSGLRRAAAFGGSMRLGYVPDQFGHVGQLPQIFAGFGMQGAALWRGVGSDVDRTLFRWQAPDGTELLTVYLIHGYGNASNLPLDPEALATRLRALIAAQKPHAAVPSLLLMNGSDHLEPQPGLPGALARLQLEDVEIELGSLPGYFERAREEAAGAALPLHRGELRSGLRAPLLEGCASARLPQKRADFLNDRLLTRYLEPLAAWLGELGGDPDPGMIEHAWRIALENHPHDSICGCSVDAVHREMDVRFERVAQIATTHLRRVASELGRRVRLPGSGDAPGVLVWNPHPGGAVQAEGEVELALAGARAPRLHLRAADGRRVPVHAEIVAPGADLACYELPGRVAAVLVRGFPEEFTGLRPCETEVRRVGEKLETTLWLGEEPPVGFDFAAARDELAAHLEADPSRPVVYRVRRRPRLRLGFVDVMPGHGLRAYRLARGRGESAELAVERTDGGGAVLRNAYWRLEVSGEGRVAWQHRSGRVAVDDALRVVSEGDRGDEYSFDPVPGGEVVARPDSVRVKPGRASEASASIVLELGLRVPVELDAGRTQRSRRRVRLPVRVELRLWEGLDRVDVSVDVDNTARDQRLRLELTAPFAAEAFEVESAFEVVERPLAPGPDDFGPNPAERPTGATPQRSFASLRGSRQCFTVANRGAAEIEALPQEDGPTRLALTLLRAVGWLSRDDLALRPGHAGPALQTPGAQVPGPHRVELSLHLHPTGAASRVHDAHRFAAPALVFAGGGASGPLSDGARLVELEADAVVVSAIEPRPGGGSLVRLYETLGEPTRARLRLAGGVALAAADARGEPASSPDLERSEDGWAGFALRPHQIACLRRDDA